MSPEIAELTERAEKGVREARQLRRDTQKTLEASRWELERMRHSLWSMTNASQVNRDCWVHNVDGAKPVDHSCAFTGRG